MRLSILLFVFIAFVVKPAATQLSPAQLTCEYLHAAPLVDIAQPRLAWVNMAREEERGQKQTAWQVRVATTPEKLDDPDLWDSGKVISEQSTRIAYSGNAVRSRQECWWQVRVWDRDGVASEWSQPAMWHMGLLDPSDWQASWIGAPWQGEEALPKLSYPDAPLLELPPPAPMLRKEFSIHKKIEKAVAYVTGLGYFELYVNGSKVSDDVLVPNTTNYGKRPKLVDALITLEDNFREYRVMYLAYDITTLLQNGKNAVGAILGNGFYNPSKFWTEGYGTPRFLGQIHITYTDGTEEVIVSDQSWKASKSAILFDMLYYGEHYDARLEQPGWSTAGFDDAAWEAVAIRKAPEGKLVAHTAPTDKVTLRLPPLSIEKTEDNTYLVDFGVEISGWLRLNEVTGPEGHKIEVKYLSSNFSGDNSYTLSGKGTETYAARFNWFVFRKVEIINWPGELKPGHLTAEAVNTQVEESATFETSNALFNYGDAQLRRAGILPQMDTGHARSTGCDNWLCP